MDFLASNWLFFDIHFLRSIQNKSAFLPKWDLLTALKRHFFILELNVQKF